MPIFCLQKSEEPHIRFVVVVHHIDANNAIREVVDLTSDKTIKTIKNIRRPSIDALQNIVQMRSSRGDVQNHSVVDRVITSYISFKPQK